MAAATGNISVFQFASVMCSKLWFCVTGSWSRLRVFGPFNISTSSNSSNTPWSELSCLWYVSGWCSHLYSIHRTFVCKRTVIVCLLIDACIALTLLVGHCEGHSACSALFKQFPKVARSSTCERGKLDKIKQTLTACLTSELELAAYWPSYDLSAVT